MLFNSNVIQRISNFLFGFIYPPKCSGCGRYLFKREQTGSPLEPFLCIECAKLIEPISSPLCPMCGVPFVSRISEDHLCGQCILQREPKYYSETRAFGKYQGVFRDIILQYKYKSKIQLAKPFSKLLYETFISSWSLDDIDLIIPVPLHKIRFRERGYNQVYLMFEKWHDNPMNEKVDRDALIRIKATKPQFQLHRDKRKSNIRNSFDVPNPDKIKNKRIVLVDDIITTGATINECARVLVKKGASRVFVLALALNVRKIIFFS